MKQENKIASQDLPMELDNAIKDTDDKKICSESNKSLPTKSYILTETERAQIHEDNLNIMKGMTEEEIKEEREKLIASMDPAIIMYLKSRRKKEILQNRNPTIKEQNQAAEDVNIEELETPSEILARPKADKWLNFDVVETNKLAWMKNIDIPNIKKSGKFEAR